MNYAPVSPVARKLVGERRFKEAIEVLESSPESPESLILLGALRAEINDLARSAAALDKAFSLEPRQSAESFLLYSRVLVDANRPEDAEAAARQAIALKPASPRGLLALGRAQQECGRLADAATSLSRAVTLLPEDAGLRFWLGRIQERLGETEAAKASFRAATSVDPRHGESLWRLARMAHREGHIAQALELYRSSVARDALNADAWSDYGDALCDAGEIGMGRAAYGEALAVQPQLHYAASNLLLSLHYDASVSPAAIFEAHLEWARRHASNLPAIAPSARKGQSRLRVGLLSSSLIPSPTVYFLEPLVRNLDKARFELFAYNAGVAEGVDPELKAAMSSWQDVLGDSDEELAHRIAGDGLDVLVDLAGHSPGGRLRTLAMKPAPVIVEWLDYFDTTGLEAVDYFIADAVSVPKEHAGRFVESLLYLPHCRLCYAPPAYSPPVAPSPCVRNGHITFGSFNRFSKINPAVVELWSKVLHAVSGSRLVVKNGSFADKGIQARFADQMLHAGIERSRLDLRSPTGHRAMLTEYGDMDIALDTFPYNGGLTTCEALWMGVPVLTTMGDSLLSRQGASMLHAAGLQDLVADSPRQFVEMAANLAAHPEQLSQRRASLRSQLRGSPLLDGPRFAKAFAELLETVA